MRCQAILVIASRFLTLYCLRYEVLYFYAVCRPSNRIAPAVAAQTYRMKAKEQEKAELETILEQVQEPSALLLHISMLATALLHTCDADAGAASCARSRLATEAA